MSEILHSNCKQYWIPYCSTEHVMSMYWNVCLMMVTVNETCSSNFTLLNILLCFDWTIFQLVLQHNGMAPIKNKERNLLPLRGFEPLLISHHTDWSTPAYMQQQLLACLHLHSLFAQRTAKPRVLCCCSHMKLHVCDGSNGCQSC